MSRKTTPDVMDSLMGIAIKPAMPQKIENENNATINQANVKAINRSKPIQEHFDGMDPESQNADQAIPKEKATFNLSKVVLARLEDCWIEIRKLRGDKKVSRTDIVEQAIEEAIRDFNLKKELSKFYSKLESNKESKQ